jgi:hypothetical protein
MLFDINDYVGAGIIGTAQQPMSSSDWELCRETANATLGALNKAMDEFILAYVSCDTECEAKITEVVNEYAVNKLDYTTKGEIFWESLINSTFTEQIHKDYSNSLNAYMYSVRKIFNIFDGDRLNLK